MKISYEHTQNGYNGNRCNGTGQGRRRHSAKYRRRRRQRFLLLLAMLLIALLLLGLLIWGLVSLFGGKEADADKAAISTSLPVATSGVSSVAAGVLQAPANSGATADYTDSPYYEPNAPPLFNRDNYIPESYSPQLASVGYGNGRDQQMEERSAAAYLDMVAAAAADGIVMTPYSGYRTHERQENNYNASIQSYVAQGYSQAEAEELTQEYYAIPGTSEHEAGLAMDIDGTSESFENTPAFGWLQENAASYGFILRYGKNDTDITHVAYEPWHYRYVGINHAVEMVRQGVTLEEYVAGLGEGA